MRREEREKALGREARFLYDDRARHTSTILKRKETTDKNLAELFCSAGGDTIRNAGKAKQLRSSSDSGCDEGREGCAQVR